MNTNTNTKLKPNNLTISDDDINKEIKKLEDIDPNTEKSIEKEAQIIAKTEPETVQKLKIEESDTGVSELGVDNEGEELEPLEPFEYNNKTEKSYLAKGLQVPDQVDKQEKEFLSAVDRRKQEIKIKISRIFRITAIERLPDKSKKGGLGPASRKEFLYWLEQWDGVNWAGAKVAPVTEHVEGYYYEQLTEPLIINNRVQGVQRTGQRQRYYVPFTKKNLDAIIQRMDPEIGDKESITYVVMTPNQRNGDYSYDQFANESWESCVTMMMTAGGPVYAALKKKNPEAADQTQIRNK